MINIAKKLFDVGVINEQQFSFLELVRTKQIVSLYYDLRLILYLGIILFTSGFGYFVYQNIGSAGHILAMFFLASSIAVGFYYIFKFSKPYSNSLVLVELNFFDYVLLLVALLIITLLSYIQIYFELVELLLRWSSLLSTSIFLFMAYRYDNRAILTMGIIALAATLGLSVSPIDWIEGELSSISNLYYSSIILGISLIVIAQVSVIRNVKAHFKSTYHHIGLLLYYSGMVAALPDNQFIIGILLILSASILSYQAWHKKEFLFFLYSNIAIYIAFTFLLITILTESDSMNFILLIYYFPFTLIAYTIFLVLNKSHFKHD